MSEHSGDPSGGRLVIRSLVVGLGTEVDLRLRAGECLCLTGASGSGKSQLLRAVADLDAAAGAVHLDGIDRQAMTGPQWRAAVMLVPSESHWWADRIVDHFPERPDAGALADLSLDDGLLDRAPGDVSSGERQRLAVLRALARHPRVLLLDEPTANLDAANGELLEARLLRERECGVSLLWVSHDPAQVRRVADRAVHLSDDALTEYAPWR